MNLPVLALVPYPTSGASSRYRAYQFVEPLRAHGIDLTIEPFWDERAFVGLYRPGRAAGKLGDLLRCSARRWKLLERIARDRVVVVHRQLSPLAAPDLVPRLAASGAPWIFDFDDAVFIPNVSRTNRLWKWLKPTRQYARLAAGANRVAAGNAWLAEWARTERPGRDPSDVSVVPTAVDTDAWTPPRDDAVSSERLVWIGSHSTVRYLDQIRPALASLARRRPNLEVHVIGADFALAGAKVFCHPWTSGTEIELVRRGAIGLSPICDDDWARGKCGLKLLLYMATGLPTVSSAVGVHNEIVEDGVNGRLARSPEAFERALEELLDRPDLRRSMGWAARATVESRYSLRSVAPQLAALLRGLGGG